MAVLCLFLLLFVFMFLGVPIAIALGLSGAVSILMFSPDSVSSLAIKLFETSDAYTFLAIPFFLLSGAFMTTGGVAQRLIDFANACVGHIRGGLAIAAVLACMLFAALSGSSPATVAAVGSIAVAGMVRAGLGVSLVPTLTLFHFDHPELVTRPLPAKGLQRQIFLLRRRDRGLSVAAQAMYEHLLEHRPAVDHHAAGPRRHRA